AVPGLRRALRGRRGLGRALRRWRGLRCSETTTVRRLVLRCAEATVRRLTGRLGHQRFPRSITDF
ncbi:hypothetical protein, partial [Streptomyces sp. NRRL S-481]|uniref:hypothetical protein n=1 Tax=Streptomyces sp. NRRL S-481 TaxID=1463911 RepID=UPI001F3A1A0B